MSDGNGQEQKCSHGNTGSCSKCDEEAQAILDAMKRLLDENK
jgi:hypothetical protein